MLLTTERHYTTEDFERLPEGAPYQLIGGELIKMSPSPILAHQRIIRRLAFRLDSFIEREQLGEIVLSPMDVFLTDEDAYQPDLIFVRRENVHLLDPNDRIRIVPDLVVEVLSPSTGSYDYSRKKRIYCESGVREYWIIDPEDRTIEIMEKEGEFYQTVALLRPPAMLESEMFPGFSMRVEDVFLT
jgi:Uma2 family endonuclease